MLLPLILYLINDCDGARVLGFFPTPSYSHQIFFHPLYRELSLRGHEVTAITTNPLNDPNLKNLTEIDVSESYAIFKELDFLSFSGPLNSRLVMAYEYKKFCRKVIERQIKNRQVQEVMKKDKHYFDLILIEGFYPGLYAIRGKFDAPLISLWSMSAQNFFLQSMGVPTHPVTNPELYSEQVPDLAFWQRWDSAIFNLGSYLLYEFFILPESDGFARKYFGQDIPYVKEFVKNTSVMIANVNPILSISRPFSPNVMEVFGMHLQKPAPLPKDVQMVLDRAEQGVIYFSLGTNVRLEKVPHDLKNIILQAVAELPFTVLLKWHTEDVPNKPKNVLIKTWFPQQDVLRHPNIKAFVTQGGCQSIEEAVVNGVPMVVVPFLADQQYNAKMLSNRDAAVMIEVAALTKEKLTRAIMEVMTTNKYKNTLKKYQSLMNDRPRTSLEEMVWWCEYVIRHKGAPHLRSALAELPLYQYYLLDVIGVTLAMAISVIFILYKLSLVVNLFVTKKIKVN